MPLCNSNGWRLEQKNNYRKCYKATKFSLSDARMEYSVVELRKNYYKTGGLFTILMVFFTTLTSNINPSITNGVVNVNIRMYNFDDVQCTVIPSVAYGFVTGMNLQLC